MIIEIPDDLIELHARKFGVFTQQQLRNKTVEECAELIVAIRHHEDGRGLHGVEVADECADVLICAAFLAQHVAALQAGYVSRKLDRLRKRLEDMPDA